MKSWLKRNVSDCIYLWIAICSGLVYVVSGDTGYLIASLVAPITQHFYEKGE